MFGLECSIVCSRDVETEKISRLDKATNEVVLGRVNEDRQIQNSIWQRKHPWTGHVLKHDGHLHEIIEGRMKGKPTARRRIQMLHDLANDGGFLHSNGQLRTERNGDRERMSKTCWKAEDYL